MNRKTAMKLFGLLGLLMLLSCGYADRHRNNSSCEQVLVDSLEVRMCARKGCIVNISLARD